MNYDLRGQEPAIPIGSLVLVTGINGYIGSHVADQLFQAGFRVRGTVRDETKGAWVKDMFAEKYGEDRIEIVSVADMGQAGAFDEACKGVSGVAHVASDVSFSPDPNQIIPGVIAGALNVASAAAKQASVKRFVYTSSSIALAGAKPDVQYHVDASQWNEEAVAAAWAPPPYTPDRALDVYAASKVQAEQALWKYATEQKPPPFVLNTVNPNFNFGTVLSDKQLGSTTAAAIPAIWRSGELPAHFTAFLPQWMVDVQDAARLHVAALVDPDVQGQRILAYAFPFNWNDVLACLRKLDPGRKLPDDVEGLGHDIGTIDTELGEELLRRFGREGWTSFEESVRENLGLVL
ncbi:MAG: hypothetical protein LQ341_006514 [Variospora aurantia]|nr:MAG: hypothetical protein LQ341_006514 [Variospora aurantia]